MCNVVRWTCVLLFVDCVNCCWLSVCKIVDWPVLFCLLACVLLLVLVCISCCFAMCTIVGWP